MIDLYTLYSGHLQHLTNNYIRNVNTYISTKKIYINKYLIKIESYADNVAVFNCKKKSCFLYGCKSNSIIIHGDMLQLYLIVLFSDDCKWENLNKMLDIDNVIDEIYIDIKPFKSISSSVCDDDHTVFFIFNKAYDYVNELDNLAKQFSTLSIVD